MCPSHRAWELLRGEKRLERALHVNLDTKAGRLADWRQGYEGKGRNSRVCFGQRSSAKEVFIELRRSNAFGSNTDPAESPTPVHDA